MNLRVLLIAAGAVAAVLFAAPAWADAILRPSVVVTGDQIRLGDLFDGVGDKANQVVAHAPEPGRRAVVDADWLQHVAALNGLDWHTDNPFLELVIERSGVTIGHTRIEQAIDQALIAKGVAPDAQIDIANRDLEAVVPVNVPATVAVRDLVYDVDSMRFTATVEAPAGATDPVRIPVAGRVHDVIEVPVPAHPIGRGEVIATSDLTFIRLRKDTLRRDVITDVDQIIGMTPRGSLRNGQALTLGDLQRPIAIQRGALVTIVLRQGAMELTVQARANEPGSIGDIIHVTNPRSNQVVLARVEGPNIVSIGDGGVPSVGGVALAN